MTVFLKELENKTPTQASKLEMGLAVLRMYLLIYPHNPGLGSFPFTPAALQLLLQAEELHCKKDKIP